MITTCPFSVKRTKKIRFNGPWTGMDKFEYKFDKFAD